MTISLLTLLLNHPVAACYAGFALIDLSLAIRLRHDRWHAASYAAAALLAITLATCAALAH